MSTSKLLFTLALVVFVSLQAISQCPFDTKFGKIKKEDFSYKSSFVDSNASSGALILFDIGTCEFESNNKGWLDAIYTYHTRIKILNKSGFEAATIKNICIDRFDILSEIKSIKASTFNLENNEVVETKIEKKNIVEKKIIKGLTESVFTLPNVKEGSIIEYSYTIIKSNTDVLNSWIFEKKYPCIYCECFSAIPALLTYDINVKGNLPIEFSNKKSKKSISLNGRPWYGKVDESTWKYNNAPPFYKEPFVNNYDNYISKVDFRSSITGNSTNNPIEHYIKWANIYNYLEKSKGFGEQIYAINEWLEKPIETILDKHKDTIRTLFEYVRDSISNNNTQGLFITNSSLNEVFNNKKGSSTDINMLLIAMLRKLSIHAYPILISTKENGIAIESNPKLSDYNHIAIYILNDDSTSYVIDASKYNVGYKKIPLNCYNGKGIVLTETIHNINLVSDSVNENEKTFVYISNEENGNSIANCKETYGYYHSLDFRTENNQKTTDEIRLLKEKEFSTSIKMKELSIDSFKLYDYPISMQYFIDYSFKDDVVYFNPMMNKAITENPFKSATRRFPIERPYAYQLNYSFNMEVPKGYKIDELPKSSKVLLNEDEGLFEYKISVNDNLIQLRCKLKFNKATYPAEDYQTIRDFYGLIVKKMSEQIVFKKNK